MIRKASVATALSLFAVIGAGTAAQAQTVTPTTRAANPLRCVGSTQHMQAQGLRIQALNAEVAALNERLVAATNSNNTTAAARIQARIAKVNARIAEVQANQAKFNTKCA